MNQIDAVCVFCGSSPGSDPAYVEMARGLGTHLAEQGIALVYGGGDVGLMGEVANGVLAGNGKVTGVIPAALNERVGHAELTHLEVVDTMHERKQRFADLADAYIALPGGLGTLEELFETLTWGQLGIHAKPCGVLDVNGYYDSLFEFIGHAVRYGFVRQQHAEMIQRASTPEAMLDCLRRYQPPATSKWIATSAGAE